MKRMNRKDRVILEELDAKYGTNLLASAIIAAANAESDNEDYPVRVITGETESNPADLVLEYIKRLEGYRIRLRELHWDAKNHARHELADALIGDLEDFEDAIAEDFMGIVGYRIQVGAVVPKLPKSTEFKALIAEITNDSISLKKSIESIGNWCGIVSLIDDAIHTLNKSQYLADLA